MDSNPALDRVRAAYKAIEDADAEAKRIKERARVEFGRVVNEVVRTTEVRQEDAAAAVGHTREYVRRFQRAADNA